MTEKPAPHYVPVTALRPANYVPPCYAPGRNDEIRARRAAGESLNALARAYGVTKQRIHQITTKGRGDG